MKDTDNDLHVCPNCEKYTEEKEVLHLFDKAEWAPCEWCGVIFDVDKVETVDP